MTSSSQTALGIRAALSPWPLASTEALAVIGSPIRHSLSPPIFNSAFAALGMNWVYLAFEVPPGRAADALEGVRALSLKGLSVTMPHKSAVAEAVDALAHPADVLKAVNCVVAEGRRLVGHNTDGAGFLAALDIEAGFTADGARCLVLGAGGAARAVTAALADAGAAEVVIVNRTRGKALEAAALAGNRGRVGSPQEASGMDIIVNATSVGMRTPESPDAEATPIDPDYLREGQLFVDLIYEPARTAIQQAAARRGVRTRNGLEMLVRQAGVSFELWTGIPAPFDVMRRAALDQLEGTEAGSDARGAGGAGDAREAGAGAETEAEGSCGAPPRRAD